MALRRRRGARTRHLRVADVILRRFDVVVGGFPPFDVAPPVDVRVDRRRGRRGCRGGIVRDALRAVEGVSQSGELGLRGDQHDAIDAILRSPGAFGRGDDGVGVGESSFEFIAAALQDGLEGAGEAGVLLGERHLLGEVSGDDLRQVGVIVEPKLSGARHRKIDVHVRVRGVDVGGGGGELGGRRGDGGRRLHVTLDESLGFRRRLLELLHTPRRSLFHLRGPVEEALHAQVAAEVAEGHAARTIGRIASRRHRGSGNAPNLAEE